MNINLKWIGLTVLSLFALFGAYSFFILIMPHQGQTGYGKVKDDHVAGVYLSPTNIAESPMLLATKRVATSSTVPTNFERKLLRDASLSMEVKRVKETIDRIKLIVESLKGYIDSVNLTSEDNANGQSASITMRIPSGSYDATLNDIKQLATKITSESNNAQDVSKQYFNLKQKIANLNQAITKLKQILKNATKVKDRLAINKALFKKEKSLLALERQMTYLDTSVNMSKITVFLTEPKLLKNANTRNWNFLTPVFLAYQSLLNGISKSITFIIYCLVYILPLLLLWLMVLIILYKLIMIFYRARGGRL